MNLHTLFDQTKKHPHTISNLNSNSHSQYDGTQVVCNLLITLSWRLNIYRQLFFLQYVIYCRCIKNHLFTKKLKTKISLTNIFFLLVFYLQENIHIHVHTHTQSVNKHTTHTKDVWTIYSLLLHNNMYFSLTVPNTTYICT